MAEHLTDLEKDTNKLCQMRLKLSKLNKTQPWTFEDLQHVLKKLPRNKARDSSGYTNELFSPEVAGDDLQKALLSLLNMIKDKQEYPAALQDSNLTTIHKKKSRIRETPTLSTDADSMTDTNLKRLRDFI